MKRALNACFDNIFVFNEKLYWNTRRVSMNEYTQNKQIKKSIQRIEDALKKIRRKWNEYFSKAFETELKRKN